VIAIDGFDARIFEELSTRGRLPNLTAAFNGPRVRIDPRPGGSGDPARVWTTVATGQPADVHGVQGLETRRVAGLHGRVAVVEPSALGRAIRGATDLVRLTRPAIASGSERRAKTFWEVAAEAGLRTAVVNWWATWPVPPDAGIVLSDRATLRLERGGPLDGELAPASLYEPLRQRWPEIKARASANATDALLPGEGAIGGSVDETTRAILQRSAELDAMQLALLSDVATPGTDLSVVYLPGLDIAQHALIGPQAAPLGDERPALTASALAARLDAVKGYYSALDRLLAPFLAPATDELVLVVTEPGRVGGDGGARLSARGAGLQPHDGSGSAATVLAPTVLYALGIPMGRDLPSAPLMDLFSPQFTTRYPVRYVTTYGRPSARRASAGGQALDEEMIERLRSLGYVR
jgi:Type I phosphodiesterase / nucleotide pyrophosphatase